MKEIFPIFVFLFKTMKTKHEQSEVKSVLEELPEISSDAKVVSYLSNNRIDWRYIKILKERTEFNDEVLSKWLDISVRTFRNYKYPKTIIKNNIKERVLVLLSLINQGIKVFGSKEEFDAWVCKPNFFFDNKSPNSFFTSIAGMRFVYDRLIAMEYGDNV